MRLISVPNRSTNFTTNPSLNDADVDVLFQQVGGEAVPERVRRHPLADPG
jgi:hypothetical protein